MPTQMQNSQTMITCPDCGQPAEVQVTLETDVNNVFVAGIYSPTQIPGRTRELAMYQCSMCGYQIMTEDGYINQVNHSNVSRGNTPRAISSPSSLVSKLKSQLPNNFLMASAPDVKAREEQLKVFVQSLIQMWTNDDETVYSV